MRKISITEALVELKLYDKKINDAIDALRVFAVAGKKKKATDMGTFGTVADFEKKSKAAWQKVMDLIRNRDELKSAIVQSNAATHLTVNGVDMTCAQAIEMKSSIQYKKTLLAQLKSTYTAVAARVEQENRRVDQNIEDALSGYTNRDGSKKISEEEQDIIINKRHEEGDFEMVDPLDIANKIDVLENEIDGFESSVDIALTVSNSTTFIEVE